MGAAKLFSSPSLWGNVVLLCNLPYQGWIQDTQKLGPSRTRQTKTRYNKLGLRNVIPSRLRYFSKMSVTVIQIQWNLDLTKSLGTGQICSLNGGFVISRLFSIHFTVTLAGT